MISDMVINANTLVDRIEYNPHQWLGLHESSKEVCPKEVGPKEVDPKEVDPKEVDKVIRIWRPDALSVHLEVLGEVVEAYKIDDRGLFEYSVCAQVTPEDYRVYVQNGQLAHDPYTFLPTVGELDLYLFAKGVHYSIYEMMGGRLMRHQGVEGAKFVIWAPSAKSVALVADFNHWDGRANPMRCLGSSGVWEIFIPHVREGEKYKFEIKTQADQILLKADPYAYFCELRPATASILAKTHGFKWQDQEWMVQREQKKQSAVPFNVYEVHLGSWRKEHNQFLNYRDLAIELASYCSEMSFTHVELLPIQEHPLDESWGYQVTGFYAPTSRFGTPEDFKWFVNHLHLHGIGIILDWVPGHFPVDDFSIGRFDGTALYEHHDERQGFHPHWYTFIFNFGRHEVSNFLLGSALYWLAEMHVDGLRVDAVASMLYLDYGREAGDWIPNQHGGKENLEAIEFFKHFNSIVHAKHPGVLTIAEESTSFPGVSHPLEWGGLGFNMKWNMGWMNDTLRYFDKELFYRPFHQNELTFGLLYAFSERFVQVLSHDEVVHGKNSLMGKMPGDTWQQFANMRLLYSYMMCHPGKKLLFMGGEIGQWNEWNCKRQIEWELLQFPTHHGLQTMVKELNQFYLAHSSLWERDFDSSGFEWVTFEDTFNCVLSYYRKSSGQQLLCVHNFSSHYYESYYLPVCHCQQIDEVFNSDAEHYAGSGKINTHVRLLSHEGQSTGIEIQLAPLATMIFEVTF